ncbi:hypothetical protein GGH95_000568 [Coemansia sp. RSA 1836]|nr:hypothetical protein GGH95_000568 [Coemansia sp. RSA 1836]
MFFQSLEPMKLEGSYTTDDILEKINEKLLINQYDLTITHLSPGITKCLEYTGLVADMDYISSHSFWFDYLSWGRYYEKSALYEQNYITDKAHLAVKATRNFGPML